MKTYTEKQTEEEHTIYQALGYKIKIQGLIKKENKTYQSILKVIEEFEPYFHTTNENIQKTTKLILGEHSTKYDANKQIQKTLPHITIEDIIQNHKNYHKIVENPIKKVDVFSPNLPHLGWVNNTKTCKK